MTTDGMIRAKMLAVSKAGHDSGTVYVIVGEEGDFLLAADGKLKSLEAPKRKNKKHLQKITHVPDEIRGMMDQIRGDADLRRILKQYRQLQETGRDDQHSRAVSLSGGRTCQKQT